jgi:membrane protease YdiL (CAAX protease family)
MHNAIQQNGAAAGRNGSTQRRMEILFYALAVLITTTAIVGCFPLLHVTSNWAENTLMFVPGLMAVAFRLRNHEGFRSVGWGAGPAIYWLWAMLLPIIVLAIVLPLTIWLGYAAMAPLSTAHGRLLTQPMKILENVFIYTAISFPLAFGEEFGWRGYAQGKFVREFGLVRGLLLLGLLWGFWHTPIYSIMGDSPAHPILGPFVMTPIDNILAVVPMAWLYIKSRSIWIPTLTHAFADVLWGFSDLLFPKSHELQSWALLQTAQLILSIVLLMNLRSRPKDAFSQADEASPLLVRT